MFKVLDFLTQFGKMFHGFIIYKTFRNVLIHLCLLPRNISHNVVEITDPFGPAIVDPDIGIVLENN